MASWLRSAPILAGDIKASLERLRPGQTLGAFLTSTAEGSVIFGAPAPVPSVLSAPSAVVPPGAFGSNSPTVASGGSVSGLSFRSSPGPPPITPPDLSPLSPVIPSITLSPPAPAGGEPLPSLRLRTRSSSRSTRAVASLAAPLGSPPAPLLDPNEVIRQDLVASGIGPRPDGWNTVCLFMGLLLSPFYLGP
jgi:hypothetical protein